MFGLAVAFAAAAMADPPIGSRLGDRLKAQEIKTQKEQNAGAHEVASCMAARKSNLVHRLLSATTVEEAEHYNTRLSGDVEDCFVKRAMNDLVEAEQVAFPLDVMRGMLAEDLVLQSRSTFAQLPPLPIQKTYSRSWFAVTSRPLPVDEMATCVAETRPGGVLNLLTTEPYSDAERAAFSALIPFLTPCLSAGAKLEGKMEPLRAALAEALFQRVNFPSSTPARVESH